MSKDTPGSEWSARLAETPALDEQRAPAGARSEPVPLLHPCRASSNALTARIHALRQLAG
jgi:hypothetical protein